MIIKSIEKFEEKDVLFTKSQALEFARKIIDLEIENVENEDKVKILENVKQKISIEDFDDFELPFIFDENVACISLDNIDSIINSLLCEEE